MLRSSLQGGRWAAPCRCRTAPLKSIGSNDVTMAIVLRLAMGATCLNARWFHPMHVFVFWFCPSNLGLFESALNSELSAGTQFFLNNLLQIECKASHVSRGPGSRAARPPGRYSPDRGCTRGGCGAVSETVRRRSG